MSLRARILLLLAIVAASVIAMAAVVYLTIRGTDFERQRVAHAHQQLVTMTELAKSADQYAEQIAEILLLGEREWPDFLNARHALEAGFARLEQATRNELVFLEGRRRDELAEEAKELERVEKLRQVYGQIDRAAGRLFLLQGAGRRAEALIVFSEQIEKRLDEELKQLLSLAIEDERAEVARTESEAAALSRRLTLASAIAILLSLIVAVGAAFMLHRSLSGSIGRLMAGASAIGEGNLHYRIPVSGGDELAILSRRFNAMAQQIEDQRQRLMLAKEDLESQVLERTQALQHANARLQHLDRSRVQFLADISHELRTPLTVLRGEAEVSLRGTARSEEDYRDTLARIVEEVAQMSRLVDDLLFLARSESDTIRFESRPIVLQEVLAEALAAGESLTGPQTVKLERDWPDASILVEADPQRLKQAVVILVDNAIKYSQNADVVRVTACRNGKFAEVSVVDRGPGVPSGDLPYVFERFYRGETGRSSELGGSGLGLPIAKWIVEKHSGSISVTSEPYRRTEFRIRLPLER